MLTKVLTEVLSEAGYEPCAYSGRGMAGEECLSITCGSTIGAIFDIYETLMFMDIEESEKRALARKIRTLKTDLLGLGYVVYWPSIPAPDAE